MTSKLRTVLLSGTAAVALMAAAPEMANAQMYSSGPGFYLSLEGRYVMNSGDKLRDFPFNNFAIPVGPIATLTAEKEKADKGFGGKVMLGYRFNNNWDVGVGASGDRLKGKGNNAYALTTTFGNPAGTVGDRFQITGTLSQKLEVKLNYYVGDFEAGYNWKVGGNSNVRLFGGVRFASFNQKAKSTLSASGGLHTLNTTGPGSPSSSTLGTGTASLKSERKTTYWGVGPRLGVNGQFGLGAGGFNIFGSVSGAVLYGKFQDKRTFNAALTIGSPPVPTPTLATNFKVKDKSKNKVVPNVGGELGIGYEFGAGSGSTVSLQAGYRADAFFGAGSQADVLAIPGLTATSKNGDYIFHGPFVRLTATFGPGVVAAVVAPPPPPPAVMPKKNFLVFFDFDRSNITADAQKVITEAAAAAKAGNVSRIQLTGHTDRSGSDAYNLALSVRRGEAVKQALIRQGIPAANIAVIGRGESQPLVPTADGVREPQNRRVEILL